MNNDVCVMPTPESELQMPLWRRAVCAVAFVAMAACSPDGGGATVGRSPEGVVESAPPAATSPEREAQPGELIATMRIPRLCNLEVKIFAISEDEIRYGTGLDDSEGASASPLNNLIPEVAPQRDCPATLTDASTQRKQNPKFATRGERTRPEYGYDDKNRNGRQDPGEENRANKFVPAAGYWPKTGKPGEKGKNPVYYAHRTSYSAAFASINVLQPGDEIIVTSPGNQNNTTVYRVTRQEVLQSTESLALLYPEGYESKEMMTLMACTPQGSAQQRIVVRAEALA